MVVHEEYFDVQFELFCDQFPSGPIVYESSTYVSKYMVLKKLVYLFSVKIMTGGGENEHKKSILKSVLLVYTTCWNTYVYNIFWCQKLFWMMNVVRSICFVYYLYTILHFRISVIHFLDDCCNIDDIDMYTPL